MSEEEKKTIVISSFKEQKIAEAFVENSLYKNMVEALSNYPQLKIKLDTLIDAYTSMTGEFGDADSSYVPQESIVNGILEGFRSSISKENNGVVFKLDGKLDIEESIKQRFFNVDIYVSSWEGLTPQEKEVVREEFVNNMEFLELAQLEKTEKNSESVITLEDAAEEISAFWNRVYVPSKSESARHEESEDNELNNDEELNQELKDGNLPTKVVEPLKEVFDSKAFAKTARESVITLAEPLKAIYAKSSAESFVMTQYEAKEVENLVKYIYAYENANKLEARIKYSETQLNGNIDLLNQEDKKQARDKHNDLVARGVEAKELESAVLTSFIDSEYMYKYTKDGNLDLDKLRENAQKYRDAFVTKSSIKAIQDFFASGATFNEIPNEAQKFLLMSINKLGNKKGFKSSDEIVLYNLSIACAATISDGLVTWDYSNNCPKLNSIGIKNLYNSTLDREENLASKDVKFDMWEAERAFAEKHFMRLADKARAGTFENMFIPRSVLERTSYEEIAKNFELSKARQKEKAKPKLKVGEKSRMKEEIEAALSGLNSPEASKILATLYDNLAEGNDNSRGALLVREFMLADRARYGEHINGDTILSKVDAGEREAIVKRYAGKDTPNDYQKVESIVKKYLERDEIRTKRPFSFAHMKMVRDDFSDSLKKFTKDTVSYLFGKKEETKLLDAADVKLSSTGLDIPSRKKEGPEENKLVSIQELRYVEAEVGVDKIAAIQAKHEQDVEERSAEISPVMSGTPSNPLEYSPDLARRVEEGRKKYIESSKSANDNPSKEKEEKAPQKTGGMEH